MVNDGNVKHEMFGACRWLSLRFEVVAIRQDKYNCAIDNLYRYLII